MKVLISGIAGFVGSHTAEALRNGGHCVFGLDNFSTGRMSNLSAFLEKGGRYTYSDITVKEGDITNFRTVSEVFQSFKPEAVIHLAAQAAISTSIENPVCDLTINGIGTLNMLNAALKCGVKHFVFSSTSAVYKEENFFKIKESAPLQPNTPYGVSKLAAEMYVRSMFPDAVVCRFGNVYGPRQVPIGENQVIARMIRHFLYGDKFFIFGSGRQERDFVYVDDVVKALTYSLYNEPGVYNIASGTSVSVNQLATIVAEYMGVPGYTWEHTQTEDKRKHVCMEVGEARKHLGWKASVGIVEGVRKTIDWWKEYGQP